MHTVTVLVARLALPLVLALLAGPLASRAGAQVRTHHRDAARVRASEPAPAEPPVHFDRPFALAAYAAGWAGSYGGVGLGGRARWQILEWLGVDLFAEHLLGTHPGGLRHDHPIGFDLLFPLDLAPNLRLLPVFGMCAVFSVIEPDAEDAPGADDVLFGVHGGVGVEWAPWDTFSFFAHAKMIGYLGHDRTAQGWTGEVDETLTVYGLAQASIGTQVHFSL